MSTSLFNLTQGPFQSQWLTLDDTDVYGDIETWCQDYYESGRAALDTQAILAAHTARLAYASCQAWGFPKTAWEEPI